MSTYTAPLQDMQFVIKELVGLADITAMPDCAEVTGDLVDAVLDEAAKFATGVLDPLNHTGDKTGARFADGSVTTPPGFKEAYRQFIAGGWNGLSGEAAYGGQGLASCRLDAGAGNVEQRQHGVLPVPDAHFRRARSDEAERHARAKRKIPAQTHRRRVDRHDESHRTAGRVRSVGGAHARGARRRSLPAARHQDLHHVGRPRHGREHRAPRARAHA
jgi:hypothetical protein